MGRARVFRGRRAVSQRRNPRVFALETQERTRCRLVRESVSLRRLVADVLRHRVGVIDVHHRGEQHRTTQLVTREPVGYSLSRRPVRRIYSVQRVDLVQREQFFKRDGVDRLHDDHWLAGRVRLRVALLTEVRRRLGVFLHGEQKMNYLRKYLLL